MNLQEKHTELKAELAAAQTRIRRKLYITSQPWLQDLINLHKPDGVYWTVTDQGLFGNIFMGYVGPYEAGIDWRNWATFVDNDSWCIDHIIFPRKVGDINIKLTITGYVKYTPDEIALLEACGKVHWSAPQPPSMSIYCER
jgi:hypothetical protein